MGAVPEVLYARLPCEFPRDFRRIGRTDRDPSDISDFLTKSYDLYTNLTYFRLVIPVTLNKTFVFA